MILDFLCGHYTPLRDREYIPCTMGTNGQRSRAWGRIVSEFPDDKKNINQTGSIEKEEGNFFL